MSEVVDGANPKKGVVENTKLFFENHKTICVGLSLFVVVAVALLRDVATQDSEAPEHKDSMFPNTQDVSAQGAGETHSFQDFMEEREADRKKGLQNDPKSRSRAFSSKPVIIGRPITRDLPLGAEVSAILLTGAGNGPVKAKLTEALVHRGETLFREGTIVLGSAQIANRRIQVQFSKAIIDDDEVITIAGTALDGGDLAPGLKAPWFEERGLEIAATMGGSLLESTATILQERESVGPYGMEVRKLNFKNAALGAVGETAKKESDYYIEGLHEQAKNFSVPAGTKIHILFQDGNGS